MTPFTTPRQAELEQVGDLDVFRLRVAKGASYEINAKGLPNYQGSVTDTRIQIVDGAGNQLAVNNNGGPGTDARLVYTAPQDGDVFVSFSAGSGAANVNTGPYEILFAPSDDFADLADYAELIEVDGGVINGALETGADVDWFAMWLEAGQTYTILADTGLTGPVLELFDPLLNSLETRDVDFFGVDFDFTPTFSGIYRISMVSEFGVSASAYTLELTGPPTGAGGVRVGTLGDDSLTGGGAADLISALEGDDTVSGLGGGDTIFAGPGDDSILSDAGADVAVGGSGADRIFGGGGNDYLQGEDGDDYLDGGKDVDTLEGWRGNDTVLGGDGNDSISGGAGADSLTGGTGSDTMSGGSGGDTLWGSSGGDSLTGDAGNDVVLGQGGNDIILGGADGDHLSGGFGLDSIFGNDGNDTIDGDAGGDLVDGGDGNDSLLGGNAADTLNGGNGNDTLNGEGFTDILNGGSNNDSLMGGGSSDTLNGDGGADRLFGNNAADVLNGGAGADSLNGGNGNDDLNGGSGNDTLLGSTGNDNLYGDGGSDVFQFRANHGALDRIFDFQSGTDLIEFRIAGINDISDVTLTNVFNGTDIDYGSGTIRVIGSSVTDLTSADFVFL